MMCRYAGAATWAEGILKHINHDATCLKEADYLVPPRTAADILKFFSDLKKTLEDFIANQYQQWVQSVRS